MEDVGKGGVYIIDSLERRIRKRKGRSYHSDSSMWDVLRDFRRSNWIRRFGKKRMMEGSYMDLAVRVILGRC